MSELAKMRFGTFVFPKNPQEINISFSRNIKEESLLENDFVVSNISRKPAKISGKGVFFGSDLSKISKELILLQKSEKSRELFLPSGEYFDVFLKDITLLQNAEKNCLSYSFTFVENCNHQKSERDFGYTFVKTNENIFDVSNRCNANVSEIMKINGFKTPFDVLEGDKVLLK